MDHTFDLLTICIYSNRNHRYCDPSRISLHRDAGQRIGKCVPIGPGAIVQILMTIALKNLVREWLLLKKIGRQAIGTVRSSRHTGLG
jgi:hypothetical protein